MSIIVTQINKYGIIFGSDSNITSDKKVEFESEKIFEIPKLNAAMCIAGSYTVGGDFLKYWLPRYILIEQDNYTTLEQFTKNLSIAFEAEMTPEEKKQLSISHIAGFENSHPEMWCLSNTTMDQSGNYAIGSNVFHYHEDFWSRDWNRELKAGFNSGGLNYQLYVNSTLEGRVGFNISRQYLDHFYINLWQLRDFSFRPPESIEEHEALVKSYIEMINTMYLLSDYKPKVIGGSANTYTVRANCEWFNK